MSNVILGIDVSEHNGDINWDEVKASGKVGFAMLRAGYGKGKVDKQFYRNASECNHLGIPIGVYWFSYAKSAAEAELEAKYCIETIKKYVIIYPVCFDFEDDSVANCSKAGVVIRDKSFATMLALNFLNTIEDAGYIPANYTNPAYLNQYYDFDRLAHYDLWLAQWPKYPDPEKQPPNKPAIWQYSSTGTVPGIKTKVDMNACYKEYMRKEGPPVSFSPTVPSIMTQDWAQEAVEKAKAYGISDGSRPDGLATRVEVMAMVTRGIEFLSTEFNNSVDKILKSSKVVEAINEVLKTTGYAKYIETQDDGK